MAAVMFRLWRRSASGAELIEFMIVFPLLMMLLAGIFDFGMLLRSLEVVTNAAREGARVAILDGYQTADVQARVDQYLQAAGVAGSHSVTVATVPITTGAGTMTAQSVTLNYFHQFVTLSGIAPFFGGSFTSIPLRAVSVMRTETQIAP